MSTFTIEKRCYDCVFRRELTYSAHSECCNPQMMDEKEPMKVIANPHGIKNGWCFWPFNFDPIWINSCSHHSSKLEDKPSPMKTPIDMMVEAANNELRKENNAAP